VHLRDLQHDRIHFIYIINVHDCQTIVNYHKSRCVIPNSKFVILLIADMLQSRFFFVFNQMFRILTLEKDFRKTE